MNIQKVGFVPSNDQVLKTSTSQESKIDGINCKVADAFLKRINELIKDMEDIKLMSKFHINLKNIKDELNAGELPDLIDKVKGINVEGANSFVSEIIGKLTDQLKLKERPEIPFFTEEEINADRKSQKVLLAEIVELMKYSTGEEIHTWIMGDKIKDENVLANILKVAAGLDGRKISEYIGEYGIKDENLRIEIAMEAAKQNGEYTSIYIKNYKIKNKKALGEIAKLAASQNKQEISKVIQNYEIEDEDLLIGIALEVASYSGTIISCYIKNYKIKNQEALIKIAKVAIEKNANGTSELFDNYGITDEKSRFEIAEWLANRHGRIISMYIRNFRITDEQLRFKIAKVAASQDGTGTSFWINRYGIEDEELRFKIAKVAASEDGGGTSLYFRYYGIEDEELRFQIAIESVKQSPNQTSFYIQNYGITDQNRLSKIAMEVANRGGDISCYIENYKITIKSVLHEIAMRSAEKDGHKTSLAIENYGIDDEAVLIKIAMKAANQSGFGTSKFIQCYKIKDEKVLLEIFLIAYKQDERSIQCVDNYAVGDNVKIWQLKTTDEIKEFLKEKIEDKALKNVFFKFIDYIEELKLSHPGEAFITDKLLGLLAYSYSKSTLTKVDPEIFSAGWKAIAEYRDPKMRFNMVDLICDFSSEEAKIFHSLSKDKKPLKSVPYKILPALFLSKLIKTEDLWKGLLSKTQDREIFKDRLTQKKLINTLHLLVINNIDEKIVLKVLDDAIVKGDRSTTANNLTTIQGIIDCGGVEDLKSEANKKEKFNFNAVFKDVFTRIIPIKEMENFNEKFLKTFGECRNNTALLTYAGRLNTLNKEQSILALNAFGGYVRSVLEGRFYTERYEKSSHLDTVFEKRDDLKNKWIKGSEEMLKFTSSKRIKMDYQKFFYRKIIKDAHIHHEEYPDICLFINEKDIETRASILLNMDEKIENEGDKETKSRFEVQKQMMLLIDEGDLESQKKLLEQVLDRLSQVDPKCELLNDLKGVLDSFKQKKKSKELKLVDTDNYWDLLMCGTEVAGSCQRVDGDVIHNKCLMAYLIDGKHRLLAIKDPETGEIIARTILRILWDTQNKKPVLLQERIYPDALDESQKKILMNFGLKRAQELGLNLYKEGSLDEEGSSEVAFESQGSKAPWEYVDSGDGVVENGIYQITEAELIYS